MLSEGGVPCGALMNSVLKIPKVKKKASIVWGVSVIVAKGCFKTNLGIIGNRPLVLQGNEESASPVSLTAVTQVELSEAPVHEL